MTEIHSKLINKTDDLGMVLIKDILENDVTGGFDIDSIYLINCHYFVLELLFCDKVPPDVSHPKYYFYKNKRKFLSLFEVTQKLNGRLLLINYGIDFDKFKVMEVTACNNYRIVTKDDRIMNKEEFRKWFKALNKHQYIEICDLTL